MLKCQKDDERPSDKKVTIGKGKTLESADIVQLEDDGGQGGQSRQTTSLSARNLTRNVPSITEYMEFGKVIAHADIVPSSGTSEVVSSPPNDSAKPSGLAFTGREAIMRLGSEDLSSYVPNKICCRFGLTCI